MADQTLPWYPSSDEFQQDTQPRQQIATKKPPIPTDDELAERWLDSHRHTSWGIGEFRRYKSGIWPILSLDIVRREIADVLSDAKIDGVRPTTRLLSSVMELARVQIALPPEQWDADPDILVCKNGVLHISTRELRHHDPVYRVTSCLDFDYDPGARSDVWEYVLDSCVPDAKDFLQEFAGLALTTETKFEIALWFQGLPGSGKSTILSGFQAMLGERSGLLGLADIERSRFALTELPGKTLVVSAEQPASYLEATHILNALISGEPVTVDRKFREQVTIVPRVKLAWAMNELPRVNSAGSGLFRRVKVIRFPKIPESEQNPEIKEQVKLAGAAILNWALEGLDRLNKRGKFDIPKFVVDATRNFQETNDIPALFVEDKCQTGSDYKIQSNILYMAYRGWCENNGHKPQSSTSLAEDWRRLGFAKYRSGGLSYWRGVELLPTEPPI